MSAECNVCGADVYGSDPCGWCVLTTLPKGQRFAFCPLCGTRTELAFESWDGGECPSCHYEFPDSRQAAARAIREDGDR